MKNKIILFLVALLIQTLPAFAYSTFYVRTPALGSSQDGGTGYDATYNPTGQCNGTANVAYDGSGTNENCAWNSPVWALSTKDSSYPQKISGGDTLIITGKAFVGYNQEGFVFSGTSSSYPWDAYYQAVPSGPDVLHKTKIYGSNYATCSGKSDTTILSGKERVDKVLNLEGTDNFDLQCLTITDDADCGEFHPNSSLACERTTYPYGDWAKNGISILDSENGELHYVYVDGLGSRGVLAGRVQDLLWNMGSISGNPYAGWDNDRGDPDNWANGGTITIKGSTSEKFKIWWNGCLHSTPESGNPTAASCFTQGQGPGYGDGWAVSDKSGTLSGAHYVFDNVDMSKNTSDGLDNLYKKSGKNTTITKSVFSHNNGNAIKTAGTTSINDTIASSDCDFFDGKSFTYTGDGGFSSCRAYGNTIAWDVQGAGDTLDIYGSTITGKGDVLIQTSGSPCDGTEHAKIKNSIVIGDTQYNGGGDLTADFYNSGATGNADGPCASISLDWSSSGSGNVIYGTSSQDSGAGIVNSDPLLTDKYSDWSIAAGSPARGIRNVSFGSTIDFNGYTRSTASGALEYGSSASSPACSNTCSICSDQTTCEASSATCYWWSTSTCNATAEGPICANTCSQCANQTTCQASAATCYWWSNSTCNSTIEPDGCSTVCSACSNQTTCQASAATCYWWTNSTCNPTAENTTVQTNFALTGRCTFSGKVVSR